MRATFLDLALGAQTLAQVELVEPGPERRPLPPARALFPTASLRSLWPMDPLDFRGPIVSAASRNGTLVGTSMWKRVTRRSGSVLDAAVTSRTMALSIGRRAAGSSSAVSDRQVRVAAGRRRDRSWIRACAPRPARGRQQTPSRVGRGGSLLGRCAARPGQRPASRLGPEFAAVIRNQRLRRARCSTRARPTTVKRHAANPCPSPSGDPVGDHGPRDPADTSAGSTSRRRRARRDLGLRAQAERKAR
jgi:hypothetical protein